MNVSCRHCGKDRHHRAFGLCDSCYRWHSHEYRPPEPNWLVCHCADGGEPEPVSGIFAGFDIYQCRRCGRKWLPVDSQSSKMVEL